MIGNSDFWSGIGIGAAFLGVGLGIGSCNMMERYGEAAITQAKQSAKSVETAISEKKDK